MQTVEGVKNFFPGTGFNFEKNQLTEASFGRKNKVVLTVKSAVAGTAPTLVPHQLVVPQAALCPLYCGFGFTLVGNFGCLNAVIYVSQKFNRFWL